MSTALWNESKLLSRLIYKIHNQHKATYHYHHLKHVMRLLKAAFRLEQNLSLTVESNFSQRKLFAKDLTKLFDMIQDACKKTYVRFEELYSEIFFVPLSVTGMALMSRIAILVSILSDRTKAIYLAENHDESA